MSANSCPVDITNAKILSSEFPNFSENSADESGDKPAKLSNNERSEICDKKHINLLSSLYKNYISCSSNSKPNMDKSRRVLCNMQPTMFLVATKLRKMGGKS